MEIPPHLFWLGVALTLGILVPVLGGHLFVLDLVLSAVLLAILTAVFPDLSVVAQFAVFLGSSVLLLPVYSWIAGRMTRGRRAGLVGHADDYRGAVGVVETRGSGVGVRVGGEVFRVRALDDAPLESGQRVIIEGFEGITAMVRRIR